MQAVLSSALVALVLVPSVSNAKVPPTTIDTSLGRLGWSPRANRWKDLIRRQPLSLAIETTACDVAGCDLPAREEVISVYSSYDPAVKAYVKHEYVKIRKLTSIKLDYTFTWNGTAGIYYYTSDDDFNPHDPPAADCKFTYSHHFDVFDSPDHLARGGLNFYNFTKIQSVDYYTVPSYFSTYPNPPTNLALSGTVHDEMKDPQTLKQFDGAGSITFDSLIDIDQNSSTTNGKDVCDTVGSFDPQASGTISFVYSVTKAWRKTLYLK